jgi:hypothetical protein
MYIYSPVIQGMCNWPYNSHNSKSPRLKIDSSQMMTVIVFVHLH